MRSLFFNAISICFSFIFISTSFLVAQSQNKIKKGYLTIDAKSDPYYLEAKLDSFYVVINDDFKNPIKTANEDTLTLEVGPKKVRVIKKYFQDSEFTTDIIQGQVAKVNTNLLPINDLSKPSKKFSSYPRLFWEVPMVIKTDPDAQIFVNEEYIGTGIVWFNTLTPKKVRTELPSGNSTTKFVSPQSKRQTFFVEEFYLKPEKGKSKRLSLLPGASQIYQKEHLKGYAFLSVTIIGAGLAVKKHIDSDNQKEASRFARIDYFGHLDRQEFDLAQIDLEKSNRKLDQSKKSAKFSKIAAYVSLGTYLVSLVDGLWKPKDGYRKKIELDPYVDFDKEYLRKVGFSARYNF